MSEFTQQEKSSLLQTAKDSIAYGINNANPLPIKLVDFTTILQQPRACFVTLHRAGQLRGCIGSLQAHQPLIIDVATNAFNAALRDPRFSPVAVNELSSLILDISVLGKPVPMQVASEADLLQKLRPGIDGLILSDQGQRATFLPSVWEQLPDPKDFVMHLKSKAGWASNYWSNTMQVEIYTTELIC